MGCKRKKKKKKIKKGGWSGGGACSLEVHGGWKVQLCSYGLERVPLLTWMQMLICFMCMCVFACILLIHIKSQTVMDGWVERTLHKE